MNARVELVKGKSAKFWEVAQNGAEVTVTFGRIGTSGQTQRRSYNDSAAAEADAQRQLNSKLKKGYRAVAAAAGAKKKQSASKAVAEFPFLFFGQGFGVSFKCLECFAWFHKAPTAAQQKAIRALIPLPVTSFVEFDGDLLSFGSGDDLELAVNARYEPKNAAKPYAQALREVTAAVGDELVEPSTKTWKSFCADFERAALAIHKVAPLRLMLKPNDQGTKGGDWQKWSLLESHQFAQWCLAGSRRPGPMTMATLNILQDVIELPATIKRLSPNARTTWLQWLDVTRTKGPRDSRDDADEFASAVFATLSKTEQVAAQTGLSKGLQALFSEDLAQD